MTALLIVEDNATFANTVVQFLSRFGDTTVAALVSTAEAALEQLPQRPWTLSLSMYLCPP